MALGVPEAHHFATTRRATMTEWPVLAVAAEEGTTTFWIQICKARESAWAAEGTPGSAIGERTSVISSCGIRGRSSIGRGLVAAPQEAAASADRA